MVNVIYHKSHIEQLSVDNSKYRYFCCHHALSFLLYERKISQSARLKVKRAALGPKDQVGTVTL